MKNQTIKMLAVGITLFTAAIATISVNNSTKSTQLRLSDIESLASCEVKRNDKIIFQCNGNEENNCKEKYKSIVTGSISIECSGTYVENN